jgi:hypothetical protein
MKGESIDSQTSVLSYVKESSQQPAAWSVGSHQYRGKIHHQQKDYDSLKAQMMINIFSNKLF